MRNKDKIAEITSDTDDKKISMSLSDMLELITTVLKQQRKKGKRGNKSEAEDEQENYLLPEDITDILSDFAPIEHEIKLREGDTTSSFTELMCGLVESTILTRVRDLSRQRKIERITEFASAQARDDAQTPRYYRPWRRLFRLTPNRAMELIIEREEQTARLIHMRQKVENDKLKDLADDWDEKYKNGQPIDFDGDEVEPEEEYDEVDAVDEEKVAPPLPKCKKRVKSDTEDEQAEGQVTIDEAIEAPADDEDDEDDET